MNIIFQTRSSILSLFRTKVNEVQRMRSDIQYYIMSSMFQKYQIIKTFL